MAQPLGDDIDGRRLIFVAGLHRSGTTPLGRALAAHPQVSGLTGTGVEEDEGQHLQQVYDVAMKHGGPGRFALDPRAHLTAESPLTRPGNAQGLWDAWTPYWEMNRRFLLEKSPPNLIMGRFLQALFPGSALVVVIRHPIVVTLSTKKWAPRTTLHRLMTHWVRAHQLFRSDLAELERVIVLRYEDLVRDPDTELARVADLLHLDGPVPSAGIQASRSTAYEDRWAAMASGGPAGRLSRGRIVRDFATPVAEYGYNVHDLHDLRPLPSLAELAG